MRKEVITQGDKVVGEAVIQRQGLYHLFDCRCRFSGNEIHRLWALCAGKQVKLGVCVPQAGEFILKTKIPSDRFPADEISVYVPVAEKPKEVNRELDETIPLEQLDWAVLKEQDGRQIICITDRSAAQQDSDQSPSPWNGSSHR